MRNRSASLNVQVLPEEGTPEGGVQKDEVGSRCRQVRQEWQANRCQLAHGDGHDAAFPASEPCNESGEHHPDAADGASVLPMSRRQSDVSTNRDQVHQHGRTGRGFAWLQAWTEQNTRCWILDQA